ncbi:MAG: PAS domain S-box protein, partial [Myxococcaceae bacterium]|nr:PAS domain S-box protein [Myxococcaceae bacterium]
SMIEFIAPEMQAEAIAIAKARLAGSVGGGRVESIFLRPDGTRVPVAAVASNIDVDGVRGAVTFVWDISARVEAEKGRLAEAQRLTRVFQSAPHGIAITRHGKILQVNKAGACMLGFDDPQKLAGLSLTELMLPEEVPMLVRRLKAAAEGQPQTPQVYRVHRKDGTVISAEVTSIPFEHEGKPAVLAFVRDVTDALKLQEQMARAERLAALSTLAGGLAHEVNNPLTAAMLQLDVLEQQLTNVLGVLPPIAIDRIAELRKTHERIAEVMRDFAQFARSGDEKRERVDLKVVLTAAERMLAPMLGKRGSYTSHIGELPPVEADASRIEQVFVNLLLNALQALPEGREGNTIELRGATLPDGRACIEIKDNGVGITTENLRRIFDPFFTTKPVGVGTGLGLTVCHNIVSSYGGAIEVDSVTGHGCTMRVLLPAAQALTPAPLTKPRTKVMIVDDEPHLANTLRMLLEDRHEVTATTQSEQAVRLLVEGALVDVVVCDLMMPEPNGMEVFRRVTERRPELKARFIFMTGGTYTGATERFIAANESPLVLKPFDPNDVEKLIARVAGGGAGSSPQ